MVYYKFDDDLLNETLMVVNLDAFNPSQGMVRLPMEFLGNQSVQVTDLITGAAMFGIKNGILLHFLWNYLFIYLNSAIMIDNKLMKMDSKPFVFNTDWKTH